VSSPHGTAGLPSPLLVRALSHSPSTLSPTSLFARTPTHSNSSKPSGSARRRSTRRHQALPPHRHSSIASAYDSASTSAILCARYRLLSRRGKAHAAFPLHGGAMAALLSSPRLAPLRPSSLPSEQRFVLAFISRSSRAPLWLPPQLALAGHRAPAPSCRHACQRACSHAPVPPSCSPMGAGHLVECGGGHRSMGDLAGDEVPLPVPSPVCVCVTCGTSGPTVSHMGLRLGASPGVPSVFGKGFQK
jgi:hypothetical protein